VEGQIFYCCCECDEVWYTRIFKGARPDGDVIFDVGTRERGNRELEMEIFSIIWPNEMKFGISGFLRVLVKNVMLFSA
jgi:hypothetical protein